MRWSNTTSITRILLQMILMTCFFESFAIYNGAQLTVGAQSGFSLQFSWFMGILFVVIVNLPGLRRGKIIIHKTATLHFWKNVLLISVIDYIYLFLTKPSDTFYVYAKPYRINFFELLSRGIVHGIYILICGTISIFIYEYFGRLQNTEKCLFFIKRFFVTIPFVFICLWGLYQWLTTFDIIPYIKVFNNSNSTGFTYLRFKNSHRTSSVFPEPSEYAYFLGLYCPIVTSFLFSKLNLFSIRQTLLNKVLIAGLYISQCLLTGSFSLYSVVPLITLISLNQQHFKKRKRTIYNISYVFLLGLFGCIMLVLFSARITSMLSGSDGSMIERFRMFWYGLELFKKFPLLGTGYGTFRAMDHISGTLAYFGIGGTIVVILFLRELYIKSRKNEYASVLYKGYLCFIAVGCAGNNLYEFLPFWIIPFLIEYLCLIPKDV